MLRREATFAHSKSRAIRRSRIPPMRVLARLTLDRHRHGGNGAVRHHGQAGRATRAAAGSCIDLDHVRRHRVGAVSH